MSGAFCTVNGEAVHRAVIERRRVGAWHADLWLNVEEGRLQEFAGAVELKLGDHSFQGYAMRAAAARGVVAVRVVGGAGGLATVVPPKAYLNVPLRIPLRDVCSDAGEALSATADASLLSSNLPKWVRMSQSAGVALAALLGGVGDPTWRILDDGALWVGTDSWTEVDTDLVDVTGRDPVAGRVEVATDEPWAFAPGLTFQGGRISVVEHRIEGRRMRHVLWMEDARA